MIVCPETPNANYNRRREGLPFHYMPCGFRLSSLNNHREERGKAEKIEHEAPFEERKRLVGIRNSVKEVENMFMVLKRMGSWQQMDSNAAFTNLEESRINLSAKVAEHKGRALDVVTELKACFGNENNVPFNWDFKERLKEKAEPAAHSRRFLTGCIRKLFISRKWQMVLL